MKRNYSIGLLLALFISIGVSSCGKSSATTTDLTGTWNVSSASGDTSAHSEPYIGYMVSAETFEQGGSMTFDSEDSITIKMPPQMILHRIHYSLIPNSKLILIGKDGHPDTATYKVVGDTLWINNPMHRTNMTLVRVAAGS